MSNFNHRKQHDSSDTVSTLSKTQPKIKSSIQPKLQPAVQAKNSGITPTQQKEVEIINYNKIANEIHWALSTYIATGGTYDLIVALTHLNKNMTAIQETKQAYYQQYKQDLSIDIHNVLSKSDLVLAKDFLLPEIQSTWGSTPDFKQLATTLHNAADNISDNSNINAILQVFAQLKKIPSRREKLVESYKSLFGSTIAEDIFERFSEHYKTILLELAGRSTVLSNEKINVANDQEHAEALAIIKRIKENFGIDINSAAGVRALKKEYRNAPDEMLDLIAPDTWEFKELVGLENALKHYAPILGSKRENSTRKGLTQEIRTVSKVNSSISVKEEQHKLDSSTLGEFFEKGNNFSMFSAGTKSTYNYDDPTKQYESIAVHEMGHGIFGSSIVEFISSMPYWENEIDKSGVRGAEAPFTLVGAQNSHEDLAESVRLFFMEPDLLQNGKGKAKGTPGNPCPERFAFIKKLVDAWNAKAEHK